MPHVELMARKTERRNIPTEPVDLVRTGTQSFLGHPQRRGRNVQNGEIAIFAGQQVVDQRRFTTTDINNLRIAIRGGIINQLKRYFQMPAVPAELVWPLGF